jgi:hypothetical protein
VTAPQTINFSGISPLSNNNTELNLFFGPGFKQR